NGRIDVTDLYTTEGAIRTYDLVALEDDLHFFPAYDAVWVYRDDLRRRLLPDLPAHHFPLSGLLGASAGPLPAAPSFLLRRDQLTPALLASLSRLEGRIGAAEMTEMNERATARRVSEKHIAAEFLRDKLGLSVQVEEESLLRYLLRLTGEHL